MGNPQGPGQYRGGPRMPPPGRGGPQYPHAPAPAARVPVPPPPASPRPAPARGGSGQYRIASGLRRPTVPPRAPVRPYRPTYGPAATQAPPQYRPVPPRPGPAAPPRGVPYGQWSMPAPAPYGGRVSPYPRPSYPQPAWTPRPPASGGAGPWIAVLVIALVALIALVLGTAVAVVGSTSTEAGPATTSTTVEVPTTAETTTTEPTTSTTSTRSRSAVPTAGATPTGTAALQGNPLYGGSSAGLVTQPCTAVGWPSNSATGKRFFDSLAPCLDRAWSAAMTAAGLSYRTPAVVVPTGSQISSPCGTTDLSTEDVAAFYCSSNETLYMPLTGLGVSHYGNQPVIYLAVFAHEYGHHVQMISGILPAQVRVERQDGRTSETGLESSRRLELQAQCFSGLFVKSVSDTGGQFTSADFRTVYEDQERGDKPGNPRDHGSSVHYQAWWNSGYQSNRLAQCNTWAASSSDVA
ncbi:neutral zinc metallopeptidase [Tsukamurella sp. USMM236]|uniref:neutral zinc metallopeptidase n=1 Tax=Tsukamurella sp. USMM236 TaxID=3081301 RepID=UPI0030171DDA